MSPNDAGGKANSVDPDQTAPLGAVWSGSALLAQAYLSENLGSLRYYNLFLSHYRVIVLESRPTDQPEAASNLYVLAGHENTYWVMSFPVCFTSQPIIISITSLPVHWFPAVNILCVYFYVMSTSVLGSMYCDWWKLSGPKQDRNNDLFTGWSVTRSMCPIKKGVEIE